MAKDKGLDDSFQTNREVLRDIHTKTNRMYNALFGDIEAKQPGLFARVHSLEKSDKKRTLITSIVTACATGVGIAGKAAYDFLFIHK
jgi:transcriptional regulatory protein LevR